MDPNRPKCLPGRLGNALLRCLQERALSSSGEWRSQIQAVDRDVLHQLQHNIAGGFDQDRFGPCIGFGNLKRLPPAPALPNPQSHASHIASEVRPESGALQRSLMVRRYLEEELAKKYRDAAPATLALLQDRCSQLSAELALAESKLHAMQDVTSLRTAGAQIQHTPSVWNFLK